MNSLPIVFSSVENIKFLASETHLWLFDLSLVNESILAHAFTLLSEQELARAASFSRGKSAYIATRAFLRESLAHYCQLSPVELAFATEPNGKPYLLNAPTPLFFNLSHSGNFAVLAVSVQARIGVDVEVARKRRFMDIAANYFHVQEFQKLNDCKEEYRAILFLQYWTLKEAFLKALGGGIALGLDKICFDLSQQPFGVTFEDSLDEQKGDWQFFSTAINKHTLIGLAVAQISPLQLRWFNASPTKNSK
jgi:4'-phosphopantetheinyl transferase